MNVGITGASGLVGTHLFRALRGRGDTIVRASLRDPVAAAKAVAACDVVVNLSGEPIAQRWTPAVKERLRSSRVDAPRAFIDALSRSSQRPAAYVSASAIGYYAPSETATYTEDSAPGTGFLAELCAAWERESNEASSSAMRVSIVRTGVVLANDGGALAKMLPPFRFGLGGVIGSGRQWISWVHVDDLTSIYLLAIDGASGVYNATAPNPVTNAQFTHALGAALHRPTIIPVPPIALHLMLGEGAGMLLSGQRVLPEHTLAEGYRFRYTELSPALQNLLA